MRQIKFNEDIGQLVDEENRVYNGRRFATVSVDSGPVGQHNPEVARRSAAYNLIGLSENRGADAYEIITSTVRDSHQEYDPAPYTANVIALLYKQK